MAWDEESFWQGVTAGLSMKGVNMVTGSGGGGVKDPSIYVTTVKNTNKTITATLYETGSDGGITYSTSYTGTKRINGTILENGTVLQDIVATAEHGDNYTTSVEISEDGYTPDMSGWAYIGDPHEYSASLSDTGADGTMATVLASVGDAKTCNVSMTEVTGNSPAISNVQIEIEEES